MQDDIICLESKDREAPNPRGFRHKFLWQIFPNIWQTIVKIILINPQEIQVRQKIDRHGNQYWYAYDPVSGKSFASGSEMDISMWIEQLYR